MNVTVDGGLIDVSSLNVGGTLKLFLHSLKVVDNGKIVTTNGRNYTKISNNVPFGILTLDKSKANEFSAKFTGASTLTHTPNS